MILLGRPVQGFAGFTRLGIVEVDGVGVTNDAAAGSSPFNAALDVTPAVNPRATPIAINRADGVTRAVVAPDTSKGSIFAGQGAVIDTRSDLHAVARPRAFQFMEYGESGGRSAGGQHRKTLNQVPTAQRPFLEAGQKI